MKLSEVIHFYYGQPCHSCIYVTGQKKSWDQGSIDTRALFNIKAGLGESIPLLRPLSSMTEEEKIELAKLVTNTVFGFPIKIHIIEEAPFGFKYRVVHHDNKMFDELCFYANLHPRQVYYLISKEFDIFKLIESQQAIDITKLNK